ncbi:hypothetical protein F4703DRAFT_1831751 [Phycomyces blakesleeanus]
MTIICNASVTDSTRSSSSVTICVPSQPFEKCFLRQKPVRSSEYSTMRKALVKFEEKPRQRQATVKKHLLPCLHQHDLVPLPSKKFKKTSYDTIKPLTETTGSTLSFWEQKANAILRCSFSSKDKELQSGRLVLLKWWKILLENASEVSYTERTIYYECILEIMSRNEFVDYDHTEPFTYDQWVSTISENGTKYQFCDTRSKSLIGEYRHMLNTTLKYAIEKMNQKALYSDIIVFCAKVLALCFFKVPGVASSLIRISEIQPNIIRRLRLEMGGLNDCAQYHSYLQYAFPQHLHSIMRYDSQVTQLNAPAGNKKSPTEVFGNWVRRWKSDDSELFFSFYRQYHATLDTFISAVFPTLHQQTLHQRNSMLAVSPGYVYIVSFFTSKVDSLLHREINSVTTMHPAQVSKESSPQPSTTTHVKNEPFLTSESELQIKQGTCTQTSLEQPSNDINAYSDAIKALENKDMSDSAIMDAQAAILSFGEQARQNQEPVAKQFLSSNYLPQHIGKPPPLEVTTKRYAECLAWTTIVSSTSGLYQDMINVLLRTVIKKTSLSCVESVFCLLDFIEATIHEIKSIHLTPSNLPIDMPFLNHTIRILLVQSDHSITLLRTLSFVYMHFSFLTPTAELLDFLAVQILLEPSTFERLLLHWGRHVRVFFLRCLMWRVGRVWTSMSIRWGNAHDRAMQRGGRGDDVLCDGRECLKVWMKNNNLLKSKGIHPNASIQQKLSYDQCALEVHLVLEAMLESFHNQYSHLQKHLGTTDESTRFDKIARMYEYTMPKPVSFPPFCSKLVQRAPLKTVPPTSLNKRNKSVTKNKLHDDKENISLSGFTKIPSKKERILRVFMPGSKMRDTSGCNDHDDIMPHTSLETTCNEFYTIPSLYKDIISSQPDSLKRSNSTNTPTGTTYSQKPSSNTESAEFPKKYKASSKVGSLLENKEHVQSILLPHNRSPNKAPINTCDSSSQRDITLLPLIHTQDTSKNPPVILTLDSSPAAPPDRLSLWNHTLPYFTPLTRSNTTSTGSDGRNCQSLNNAKLGNNIPRNTIDFTRDQDKLGGHQPSQLPKRVLKAHKWRYAPTNHVYADKIVEESRIFVHDYCAWAGRFGYENGLIADNFVPGLSLDWPKNWSYSQM